MSNELQPPHKPAHVRHNSLAYMATRTLSTRGISLMTAALRNAAAPVAGALTEVTSSAVTGIFGKTTFNPIHRNVQMRSFDDLPPSAKAEAWRWSAEAPKCSAAFERALNFPRKNPWEQLWAEKWLYEYIRKYGREFHPANKIKKEDFLRKLSAQEAAARRRP